MNRVSPAFRLFAACALAASSAWAAAGPTENVRDGREPTPDANGVISRKIIHRLAPVEAGTLISPFGAFGAGAPSGPSRLQPTIGTTASNAYPISYHGGPVMAGVSKVVLIWYGNWKQSNSTDTPAGQQILRDAVYGLAQDGGQLLSYGGPYLYAGITAPGVPASPFTAYQDSGSAAVGAVSSPTLAECVQPASSAYGGATLTDAYVLKLVQWAASNACSTPAGATTRGPDANAVYLVLSSSNIAESSGFLKKYCGWHSHASIGSAAVKYGFIGNPARRLSACSAQSVSPNANPGVDAMVSVVAHELEETVTDPLLNAWHNAQGSENGDMCAWTFGSAQHMIGGSTMFSLGTANNGAYYNAVLPTVASNGGWNAQGVRPYLLQRALAAGNSACYANESAAQQ